MRIPASFDIEDKHFEGYLSKVSGAAGITWHFMQDGYYIGQLVYTAGRWSFTSNFLPYSQEVSDYLGGLTAWEGE